MPEECASRRSMARCVLPVLVGPSTAVTPAPGARSEAKGEEEKAIGGIGNGDFGEMSVLMWRGGLEWQTQREARGHLATCSQVLPRLDRGIQCAGMLRLNPRRLRD